MLVGNISASFNRSFSVFVTINGDVYIDNGHSNGRVDKFTFNSSTMNSVMTVNGSCYGLYVSINNYLYCSMKNSHQVVNILLNNGSTIPSIVAGTGVAGSSSNMLNSPQGIYVDNNLNLYVADCGNDRIQFFNPDNRLQLLLLVMGHYKILYLVVLLMLFWMQMDIYLLLIVTIIVLLDQIGVFIDV